MSPTYFSVDVETTGTNPFMFDHQLATVGAVAIDEHGLILGSWYQRLEFDLERWDPETKTWWLGQNQLAKNEMFSTKDRKPAYLAAHDFTRWVLDQSKAKPGDHEIVFVANPSSFDFGWIQRWFHQAWSTQPFSYRTMCLRSAAWGRNKTSWLDHQRTNKPRIPHHALHDAQAQAFDLLELLP